MITNVGYSESQLNARRITVGENANIITTVRKEK